MTNKRKRQEAASAITHLTLSSIIITTSEDLHEMIKQVIEEAYIKNSERQELIYQEIESKIDGLSDQVKSIKDDSSNLSSVTASVANTTTADSSKIPKPRTTNEQNKSSLIFHMFNDNIAETTDDEANKLAQYLNEAAKDACKLFAAATDKGMSKYIDLKGNDRHKLFKLVVYKARTRDERSPVADGYSGLWAYEFVAQPKWISKMKNFRKKVLETIGS